MNPSINQTYHDQLTQIYDVTFFGNTIATTVTRQPHLVRNWISECQFPPDEEFNVVGVEVEWNLVHHQNGPDYHPSALLMMCYKSRCIIFQLLHLVEDPTLPEVWMELNRFLNRRDLRRVGIKIRTSLRKLSNDTMLFNGFGFDLCRMAAHKYHMPELDGAGLRDLAGVVLQKDVRIPRYVSLSDWDAAQLVPEQVMYACINVCLYKEMGEAMLN